MQYPISAYSPFPFRRVGGVHVSVRAREELRAHLAQDVVLHVHPGAIRNIRAKLVLSRKRGKPGPKIEINFTSHEIRPIERRIRSHWTIAVRQVCGRHFVKQFAKVRALLSQRFDARLNTAFVDEFAEQRDQLGAHAIPEVLRRCVTGIFTPCFRARLEKRDEFAFRERQKRATENALARTHAGDARYVTPAKEFQQRRLGLVISMMTLEHDIRFERLEEFNCRISTPLSRICLKIGWREGLLGDANVKLDVQSRAQRLDEDGVVG
jgi:hypothetical protein